jgi:hypothetical protein
VLHVVRQLRSPTALTFLAGILAGTGINLITAVAIGDSSADALTVVVDAIAWVAAAAFLSSVAQRIDAVQRQSVLYATDPHLSHAEKQSEHESQLDRIAVGTTILLGLAVTCVVVASVLLLGMIDWSRADAVPTSPQPSSGVPS